MHDGRWKNPMAPPHAAAADPRTADRRGGKTLAVTNLLARYPWVVMGAIFAGFVLLAYVGFGVIGFTVVSAPLRDWGHSTTEIADAMQDIEDRIENAGWQGEGPVDLLRSKRLDYYSFVFKTKHDADAVFTVANVRWMKYVEEHIRRHIDFKHHCRLNWYAEGSLCPGIDCPWYIPAWDVTVNRPLPDGSRLVCASPLLESPAYFLYNTEWVITEANGTATACGEAAMVASPALRTRCLRLALPGYLPRAALEAGGVEPTQYMLDFFVEVAGLVVAGGDARAGSIGYLEGFFGKARGASFGTGVTKSLIDFGGPVELSDPDQHAPCHEAANQSACAAVTNCAWVGWAGVHRNATGCAPLQYSRVSGAWDSILNDDQTEDLGDYFTGEVVDFVLGDAQDGPIDVLFACAGVMEDLFNDILVRDMLLSMGSFFFVYLYMQIHTGSFMLASLGLLQVIMSFPIAYFFYYTVFQVKGFFPFSTLTTYIMLAIGADDLFVFFDNWTHAGAYFKHPVDLPTRLCRCWKSAGKAMAVTSVTTMAAFAASMTSPLIEISTFGLFAALLVFFDYLLCMTFFAASIVAYHRTFEHTVGCCCCGESACGALFNCCTCFTTLLQPHDDEHPACLEAKLTRERTPLSLAGHVGGPEKQPGSRESGESAAAGRAAAAGCDSFKADPGYRARVRGAWGMLVGGAAVYAAGFAALQADTTPPKESQQYLLWILILVSGLAILCASANAFRSSTDRLRMLSRGEPANAFRSFVNGRVAPFLSGMVDPSTSEDHDTSGSPAMDRIRASPVVWTCLRSSPVVVLVVLWVVMVAGAAKLSPTSKVDELLPSWHPYQRFVRSQTRDFEVDAKDDIYAVKLIFGLDPSRPIDRAGFDEYDIQDKGTAVLSRFPGKTAAFTSPEFQRFGVALCEEVVRASRQGALLQRVPAAGGAGEQCCLPRGFRDWRNARGLAWPVVDPDESLAALRSFVGEAAANRTGFGANGTFTAASDRYDDKVLFSSGPDGAADGVELMFLTFNTSLRTFNNAYRELKDWYDAWDAFTDEINSGAQPWAAAIYGAGQNPWRGQVLQSSDVWPWMHVQKVLVDGAYQGTAISLGLAAFFVLLATMNVLVCALVLLELIGVVGCVMGMIYYIGWEMSMVESVSVTILVGISVDYVVHYAIHYSLTKAPPADELATRYHATERQYKAYFTVTEMGPTVLGGAATSVGATLVLFCTWIQFFYKFGAIFLMTIVFSFVWALLFFVPLLSYVGPQGDFASFRPLIRKAAALCCSRDGSPHTRKEGEEGCRDNDSNPASIQH
ncbi:Protein dispatched [Diplonema papillatum]|nr:Protein dispatched [Diplonema papillatum]